MANIDNQQEGLKWQIGVWDRISEIYLREVDKRFEEVINGVLRRAALQPGQQVLDLGTGTGSVALKAASSVSPGGNVTAVDINPDMLALAQQRAASMGLSNVTCRAGRAEDIPAPFGQFVVGVLRDRDLRDSHLEQLSV